MTFSIALLAEVFFSFSFYYIYLKIFFNLKTFNF